MIQIDGSQQSGSGTLVRFGVAFSALCGEPLRLVNARARRPQPGLRAQHVAAVRACAELCGAETEGVEVGSRELVFRPGPRVRGGDYVWEIGTAGSAPMLALGVLAVACLADAKLVARIGGGVFQDFAPSPFHLQHVLAPLLARMGASVSLSLVRPGYVPAGADVNGTAHGRRTGYPFWDANDPKVLETAQYFDTANCAARIKVPSLVSLGFIDTATPPVGIWSAYNVIRGPKQVAPMTQSPHNHLATPEQSKPWNDASARWLSALVAGRPPIERADVATPRTDENSRIAHEQLLAKRTAGQIDVYFVGDSITRRWGTSDEAWKDLLENWNANFKGWNAANFGWGADKTQHMLWRLQNGELDGVNPKVVVVMAGTNNIGNATPIGDADARAADVARGVAALLKEIRKRAPGATVVLTGITPRNDNRDVMPVIDAANRQIAALANGKSVRYININGELATPDGALLEGMTFDGLHLTPKAYQHWANALKPILTEILGPPAAIDRAPPPTGDPSAARRQ